MLHVPKRVGIALIVLGLAVLGLSVFVIYINGDWQGFGFTLRFSPSFSPVSLAPIRFYDAFWIVCFYAKFGH